MALTEERLLGSIVDQVVNDGGASGVLAGHLLSSCSAGAYDTARSGITGTEVSRSA